MARTFAKTLLGSLLVVACGAPDSSATTQDSKTGGESGESGQAGDGDGDGDPGDGDGDPIGGDGDGGPAMVPDLPAEPEVPGPGALELDGVQPRTLRFSWQDLPGATYYEIHERLGDDLEFELLAGDIAGTEHEHTIPLLFRAGASYALKACNEAGCSMLSVAVPLTDMHRHDAIGYLKASNTNADDRFGRSLAMSADGSVLAVGARHEDGNGINNPGSDGKSDSGAVYVFEAGGWDSPTYLKPEVPTEDTYFGFPVALSSDGEWLAVGSHYEDSGTPNDQADISAVNSGAVHVFRRGDQGWAQHAYLKASNIGSGDLFGWDLALSGDGQTLAVGARYEDGSATEIDGGQDEGASDAGAVYVFERGQDDNWVETSYIKASNTDPGDQLGISVAISDDGSRLVVGAFQEESAEPTDPSDNSTADVGAAYVFDRDEQGEWAQTGYLKPLSATADDWFGLHVEISGDGETIAVGAQHVDSAGAGIGQDEADDNLNASGAAYVFIQTNNEWTRQAYIKPANPMSLARFGRTLSLSDDGDVLAVGAFTERSAGVGIDGDPTDAMQADAGAAYVFVRAEGEWAQHAYLKAKVPDAGDYFGLGLDLSADGRLLAVGAEHEDGSTVGLGGDEDDNTATKAGAVFLF